MGKILNLSIYALPIMLLSGCLGGAEEDVAPPVTEVPGTVFDPIDPAEVGQCFQDTYEPVPVDSAPSELDIVIVSYGSINLKPQRDRLANNLDYLISSLSPDIDYRVGVIQGFGDHWSRSGRLYKRSSEPYVLRSDLLTTEEIQGYVRSKLTPHPLEVVLESIFLCRVYGYVFSL